MISGYYDEEGLLWIGTEGGGVLFSDLRQLFYHQYAQTRSNEICGIQMDEDGYVWLATFHKECCGARSLLTYHIRCRLNRLIPAFRA